MRRRLASVAFLLALVAWLAIPAAQVSAQETGPQLVGEPEQIQIGISADVVPVTSEFGGASIAVFGDIENLDAQAQFYSRYGIAVVVSGPERNITVRKKQRVLGIWMNRNSRVYAAVPESYFVVSDRPLEELADAPVLRQHGIGNANLSLNLFSIGGVTEFLPAPEFAAALRDLKTRKALFSENPKGVTFLGKSLFRATIRLPSNVPIGLHRVDVYLFKDGKMIATRSGSFRVEKEGFEKTIVMLAQDYSLAYGLIAVLLALVVGWLASVIFNQNRK